MLEKSKALLNNESKTEISRYATHVNASEPVRHIDVTTLDQQQQHRDNKASEEPPPPPYYVVSQLPADPVRIQEPKPIGVTMIHNVSVLQNHRWPRVSITVVCPHCSTVGPTRVETASTCLTFILAIFLFLLCCCLFFVPFCVPSCQRTTHYCSRCNAVLAEINAFD